MIRCYHANECDYLIATLAKDKEPNGRAGIRHLMRAPEVQALALARLNIPRHVLHIEYTDALELTSEICLAVV